jgi:hypothetical protein
MRVRNVSCAIGLLLLVTSGVSLARDGGSDQEARIEPRALQTLQSMARFFEGSDAISFQALASTEDVSSSLQKLTYETTIDGVVQRPDKVYLKKSGNDQVTLWFDGQTATFLDRASNHYARIQVTGGIRGLIDRLDDLGIETPFAGLIDPRVVDDVQTHAFKGDFYGAAEVDGMQTNHLAFRQDAVDWQLWTDASSGAPKKLVITSKMLAGSPEHQIFFKTLVRNPSDVTDAVFQAQLPSGATEVQLQQQDSSTDSIRNTNW